MTRILFICHGNICRSPMAHFFMQQLVDSAGLHDSFFIDSAAVSAEELGNPIYPPARAMLESQGVPCLPHRARQICREDYERFDLLIGMDRSNIRGMTRIFGGDPQGKLFRLPDFTDRPHDVADPWYTGDFRETWNDVSEGCRALLDRLRRDRKERRLSWSL